MEWSGGLLLRGLLPRPTATALTGVALEMQKLEFHHGPAAFSRIAATSLYSRSKLGEGRGRGEQGMLKHS